MFDSWQFDFNRTAVWEFHNLSTLSPEINNVRNLNIFPYFHNLALFTAGKRDCQFFFFFFYWRRGADQCVNSAIWGGFTALHACVKCYAFERDVFWCSVWIWVVWALYSALPALSVWPRTDNMCWYEGHIGALRENRASSFRRIHAIHREAVGRTQKCE